MPLVLGVVLWVTWRILAWQRRRSDRAETARVDALIRASGRRSRFTGQDDALRIKTEQRRRAADGLRMRAAHVESGAPVADVLRMVKR